MSVEGENASMNDDEGWGLAYRGQAVLAKLLSPLFVSS